MIECIGYYTYAPILSSSKITNLIIDKSDLNITNTLKAEYIPCTKAII